MKILLVDPPGTNKGLNTGLGYLSAVLKDYHEVKVLDLNNISMGLCGDPNPEMPINELEERVIKAVNEFEPDFFGISVKTFTAEITKHILRFIKDNVPKLLTIVGGPHITLDGKSFSQDNYVDFAIQGEGEYTFVDLCGALEKDEGVENIEGVYYWKNGELIHNPRSNTIKNLDAIPFPCYDNFSSIMDNNGIIKEYPILSSRGCPYSCSYCSMPSIMGQKWRSHSTERVIQELKQARQKYGCTSFTVVDDNFTLNLKRVESICDKLVTERLGLPWNSQNGIRADRISKGLAIKMKASGCQFVWIGIESADENVFNQINKGEKLEDIKTGILHLKAAGIRVGGFFITGLPYSTKETDLKSIEFVKEQRIEGWWFNFVPYPHTRAYDWVQTHGRILRPIEGALQFGTSNIEPVFETEEYIKEDRIKTYNEIHIKLKCFDRLTDPSLTSWHKWIKIFKMVSAYGSVAILSLFIFILKHNMKLVIKGIKK